MDYAAANFWKVRLGDAMAFHGIKRLIKMMPYPHHFYLFGLIPHGYNHRVCHNTCVHDSWESNLARSPVT